MQIQP